MNEYLAKWKMGTITLAAIAILIGCIGCGGGGEPAPEDMLADGEGHMRVRLGDEEFYVAPAPESRARAGALLPMRPSEDVSDLLGRIDLPSVTRTDDAERDYLPHEGLTWILSVRFPGEPKLDAKKVDGTFDRAWRHQLDALTGYGLDADTGRWTFLISGDGPTSVTRLKFAWPYVAPFRDDDPLPTASLFEERLAEVANKLRVFGEPQVTASLPPDQAVRRAQELRAIKSKFDYHAILMLKAPPGNRFDGKEIWDVMLCLGLRWGDMDCFHWENPTRAGDDYFFSVHTSTHPGYFLPEEIAAGRVHVDDLVFSFSVPRCRVPGQVFDAMVKAVEYCKKRLQGDILDEDGKPADVAAMRKRIANIDRGLRDVELPPGSSDALQLF